MHEIIVGNLSHQDSIVLGIRWRNPRTHLLDQVSVEIRTDSDPRVMVAALRELADSMERSL